MYRAMVRTEKGGLLYSIEWPTAKSPADVQKLMDARCKQLNITIPYYTVRLYKDR
jgi:hypothetical protein